MYLPCGIDLPDETLADIVGVIRAAAAGVRT